MKKKVVHYKSSRQILIKCQSIKVVLVKGSHLLDLFQSEMGAILKKIVLEGCARDALAEWAHMSGLCWNNLFYLFIFFY